MINGVNTKMKTKEDIIKEVAWDSADWVQARIMRALEVYEEELKLEHESYLALQEQNSNYYQDTCGGIKNGN
jgi:hypothetical protein